MKAKLFAVVLVVLALLSVMLGSSAFAQITRYDTIGTQFGFAGATRTGSFHMRGWNSAADSIATMAAGDSGAAAGDSSSHIFWLVSTTTAVADTVDSIGIILPAGFIATDSGTFAVDSLTGTRIPWDSIETVSTKWHKKAGANFDAGGVIHKRDTIVIRLKFPNAAATRAYPAGRGVIQAFSARFTLSGIVNDTTLFNNVISGDSTNEVTTVGTFTGYRDTVRVVLYYGDETDSRISKITPSDSMYVMVSAGAKKYANFFRGTGTITTPDTAGTMFLNSTATTFGAQGTFWAGIVDTWGNALEDDSSTVITIQGYDGTGANPPGGAGRLRQWDSNAQNPQLIGNQTGTSSGRKLVRFAGLGYSRVTTSGVRLRLSATGVTFSESNAVTLNAHKPATVTFVSSAGHTSPDTMTVGLSRAMTATVVDSFSNSNYGYKLKVQNQLGGTMSTTAPHYFYATSGSYTSNTTATTNPDTAKLNSSGQFVFTYQTAGSVGYDTLRVTPAVDTSGTSYIATLETKYIIRIAAGSVTQVAISPVNANLSLTGRTGTSSRYTNKAEVHPDTTTFQGAVIAGDTIVVFVVLKDANGNVSNFTTADIAQVSFNSNRKGTVLSGSTLDTVTIGSTSFVVGKFFYRAKTTVDKDSIRATYSSFNSTVTEFQTVGGPPNSAVLISPNTYAGTSSVAADTFPVVDSLLVMGYVLDKNGNFADSGATVTWSKVSGGGGYRIKFPNSLADSNTTVTPADLGYASWAILGDTLEYFGHASGLYNFTKDTTIGSGSYNVKKTYIQAKLFSDSLAGEQLVVKASYGTTELDQIRLYKQPKSVAKVDLTVGRSTSYVATQVDTTITSGQTVYLFSKFMDAYNNVITPDTADNTTTTLITWPKTSVNYANGTTFDRTYTTDKIFKKTGLYNLGKIDSVRFASRAGDTLGVASFIYTDSTVVQSGTPHIRVSYKTTGTKAGYDWILVYYAANTTATVGSVRDSVRIKTSLPVALASFRIAVNNEGVASSLADTAGGDTVVAGQPLHVRLIPIDANGNDIFTYTYRYLKLAVQEFTHTDTIKVPMTKLAGRSGIYWKGNDATTLTDSTMGTAYGRADADCTFSDNTEDFIFYTSNVDAALTVKVWTVPKDPTQNDTITKTMSGTIKVKNAPMDTVVLSASARSNLGFWQDTPFDLRIAIKDSFINAVLDTGYIVTITANHNGIDGIDKPVIVTSWSDIRIKLDHQMNDLLFLAQITNDILGNARSSDGYLGDAGSNSGVDVGAATVNAPATLRGQDFPGDAGGYIMLTFPPSANHPGLGTSVSMNLPIDYYMVYRSSTSSAADAVQWSIITATPLPTGIDSIRSVIDVKGATSTLGYYWVAAVKGTLPPGVVGSSLAKEAGIQIPENAVMSVRVNEEMNLSAAAANEKYAVVSADGNSVISNLSNRVSARAVDNSLPRGIFTMGGTVVTLSDVMIVASVFGDERNFDPVFDVVQDGVIDLRDIIWQIFRLGTTPKNGEEGALINDGINQSASLKVESLSSTDDVFNLQVSLKATEEVAGYRFTVVYNPEHYEFIKANQGGFMTSEDGSAIFQVNDEVDGQVTVVALYTGSKYEAAKGDGILADMEFAWMGDELSEIKVQDIQLIDASALINELEGVLVERPVALPNEFALAQNYPNPFNPETTIKFSIPEASNVKLVIYNILGQKVRELVSENMKPGFKRIVWDGTNDIGVKVSSGIYIYQIRASNFVDQKKMVFMK